MYGSRRSKRHEWRDSGGRQTVAHAFARLAEFPEIGSPRVASDPSLAGLRLWPVPGFEKFRICYVPRADHIDVLRVLHGARDSERFFE